MNIALRSDRCTAGHSSRFSITSPVLCSYWSSTSTPLTSQRTCGCGRPVWTENKKKYWHKNGIHSVNSVNINTMTLSERLFSRCFFLPSFLSFVSRVNVRWTITSTCSLHYTKRMVLCVLESVWQWHTVLWKMSEKAAHKKYRIKRIEHICYMCFAFTIIHSVVCHWYNFFEEKKMWSHWSEYNT